MSEPDERADRVERVYKTFASPPSGDPMVDAINRDHELGMAACVIDEPAGRSSRQAAVSEQWRLFIGLWDDGDPDWAHVDEVSTDYVDLRSRLLARYVRWRDDSCTDCVASAAEDEARLRALPDHAEFVGEVEGEDYLLIRADRTELAELGPGAIAP